MAILIKNGIVFDGSGEKGERADVLIEKDKIIAIGALAKKKADTIIDANGLYLAPGFIDINSDSDHYLTIFTQPSQTSLLKQGITTILTGNCGSSLAPLIKGNLISIRKWADPNQVNVNWQSFGEFLEKLSQFKIGVNFGTLVGHATIRRGLIGEELRDLTDDELKQMKYLVEESLAEGAFGVSTGLSFSHSRITPPYEILEILKIVEKYDSLYATHLRSEKEGLIAAMAEIGDLVAELKKTPRLEISHLKAYQGLEDDLNQSLHNHSQSLIYLFTVLGDLWGVGINGEKH
jgi:N-acyl-D-amino-acid deacylase